MGAGLRQVAPDRFASHFGELLGHIFVPGPVITYDRSQPVTRAGLFGPGQGGWLMTDMAASRAADGNATVGDRLSAGRAGPAAQRYEVRPVAWVESPLKHLAHVPLGVFSTRSPDRPNPIGVHRVQILTVEGLRILVSE